MACYSIKTRPFIKIMPTTLLYLPCLKLQMGYRLGFFVIFLGGGLQEKKRPAYYQKISCTFPVGGLHLTLGIILNDMLHL